MPANMIMAETGDILKVAGKRIAIVPGAPIPGSTPTKVPIRTPRKQNRRLEGSSPTEKPYKRLWTVSNSYPYKLFCPKTRLFLLAVKLLTKS